MDAYISGPLECIGDPDIRPGKCIDIERVGKLFSGKYYIKSAKHTFDINGYRTSLEVRRVVV